MLSFKKNKHKLPGADAPIFVLGDSHTRAYSFNANFMPLFLGQGKTHCLISDEVLEILKADLNKALKAIPTQRVLLVIGEPDTRYYLGKGWYPWDGKQEIEIEDIDKLVYNSIARYRKLLLHLRKNFLNTLIVTSVPPTIRREQNIITDDFNDKLGQLCTELEFSYIDINKNLYERQYVLSAKFVGDPVHLNHHIQPFIENQLVKIGYLTTSHYSEQKEWDHLTVKGQFKYNKQFGCYTLK